MSWRTPCGRTPIPIEGAPSLVGYLAFAYKGPGQHLCFYSHKVEVEVDGERVTV